MRMTVAAGLMVLLAAPLAPTPAQAQAQAQSPLPAVSLRLGCHDEGAEATRGEVDGIANLLEFASEHDGQVVYLDAVITANDGAGTCSRDLSEFPDQEEPEPFRAMITLDPCRAEGGEDDEGPRCARPGIVHLRAFGPPLAITNPLLLPAQEDLPLSLPYLIHGYGDWLNYQGPFIVRYMSGTGYEHATFDVPDPALAGVWERARLNAEARPRP